MTRSRLRNSSGVTLFELIVTVALIGIVASVVTLGFPVDRTPPPTDPLVQIARARAMAIEMGRNVAVTVVMNGRPVDAFALADGSVITDTTVKLERLVGR